jgi:hypothetical protein
MSRVNAHATGVATGLDRMILAQHRCRPDELCTCGMDREACRVARQVRMLLSRQALPLPSPSTPGRRAAAESLTGPGRVSPPMAARPGASPRIDREGPR